MTERADNNMPKNSALRQLLVLYKKEMLVLFLSPLAWMFIASTSLLAGVFFLIGLQLSPEPNVLMMMRNLSTAMMFLLPMVTMNSIAAERKNGSLTALSSLPVSSQVIIFAKYAAICSVCFVSILSLVIFPLILVYLGPVSWASVIGSFIALLCVLLSMSAIGLFSSSLSEEPMVSGLLQVIITLPFWLSSGMFNNAESRMAVILREASFNHHVSLISSGLIDFSSVYYFAAISGFFLFLTVKKYDWTRG